MSSCTVKFSASRFWDICRRGEDHGISILVGSLLNHANETAGTGDDDADNPVQKAFGAPTPLEIYEAV